MDENRERNRKKESIYIRLSDEDVRMLAWLTGYLGQNKSKVLRDALKRYYDELYDFYIENEF